MLSVLKQHRNIEGEFIYSVMVISAVKQMLLIASIFSSLYASLLAVI